MSGELVIPSSATSIGNTAFNNTAITSVVFEETDNEGTLAIGNNCFADCTQLDSVTFEGKIPPSLGNDVFKSEPKYSVPDGYEDVYLPNLQESNGVAPSMNEYEAVLNGTSYLHLEDAIESAGELSGDVTIYIPKTTDLTGRFTNNTLGYDLSDSFIASLTIAGQVAESDQQTVPTFVSGVGGHGIDGPVYCPVLRFTLPSGVGLTVSGITFEDDLWIDSSGPVTYTGCTFDGAISAYPTSDSVKFDNNVFDFDGNAAGFHTNNAFPIWFKVDRDEGETFSLVFTNNEVTGYRGVHVENRSSGTADITVNNNVFNLSDTDPAYANKAIALQLVNQMNGDISFQGNTVNAYMAVCLFKGVNLTGTITYADNTLSEGCKPFGSSEWSFEEGDGDPDDFADSLRVASIGETIYPTVESALDDANDGETVLIISESAAISTEYSFTGDAVLDLNDIGLSVETGARLSIDGGNLEITNGTFETPASSITLNSGMLTLSDCILACSTTGEGGPVGIIWVYGSTHSIAERYSVLNVESDATITHSGQLSKGYYAICLSGANGGNTSYGVEVNMNGTITGDLIMLSFYTNGSMNAVDGNAPKMYVGENATTAGGIYAAGYAEWEIRGGQFVKSTALSIKSGVFNIYGGTFHATGSDSTPPTPNSNGTEETGAAVSITTNSDYAQRTVMNIYNGEFISDNGYALFEGIANDSTGSAASTSAATINVYGGDFDGGQDSDVRIDAAQNKKVLRGGSFSTDVSSYCADGFSAEPVDGRYVVENSEGYSVYVDYGPENPDALDDVTATAHLVNVPDGTTVTYTWCLNGSEIPSSNMETIEVDQSGTYHVVVSMEYEGDTLTLTSEPVTITITPVYCLTFDVDGVTSETWVVAGKECMLTPASKEGYVFFGWAMDDGTLAETVITPERDMRFTAVFVEVQEGISTSGEPVEGGSVTLSLGTAADWYYSPGEDVEYSDCIAQGVSSVTVTESGHYWAFVYGEGSDQYPQAVYATVLEFSEPVSPFPPINPGGDDDYVPPIYVPSDTSSSDDDTVKIVACAAAAVVAAIMAAFLILGHRRE